MTPKNAKRTRPKARHSPPKSGEGKAKAKSAKGGKPGNQNARQHGLYAKHQPPAQASNKKASDRRDTLDEIISRLYSKFQTLDDIDDLCKCATAITNAVIGANSCDRTEALISGKLTTLNDAIDRLLNEEDPDDPRTLE